MRFRALVAIVVVFVLIGIIGSIFWLYKSDFLPKPLTMLTCPSGYYAEMKIFSKCSNSPYVVSGWSVCEWSSWDVEGCRYYNPICYRCSSRPCGNCGQESPAPPTCPPGKSYVVYQIKCDDSNCYQAAPIGRENCKTCTPGYLNEYKCKGDWIMRKYRNEDCTEDWRYWYNCADEGKTCENGKCVLPKEEPPIVKIIKTIEDIFYSLVGGR